MIFSGIPEETSDTCEEGARSNKSSGINEKVEGQGLTFFMYKNFAMSKVTGWKVLVGELPTPFYTPANSLTDLIQKYQKEGWVLKGQTTRAHPSSIIWTQRVVRYAKIE